MKIKNIKTNDIIEIKQWLYKFPTIPDSFPYGFWYILKRTTYKNNFGHDIIFYLHFSYKWLPYCEDGCYFNTKKDAENYLNEYLHKQENQWIEME